MMTMILLSLLSFAMLSSTGMSFSSVVPRRSSSSSSSSAAIDISSSRARGPRARRTATTTMTTTTMTMMMRAAASSSTSSSSSSTTSPSTSAHDYVPIFDFSIDDPDVKKKSSSSFERIDDAIMGGISLSSLRDVPHESYAIWSGVCRVDGGGFCGLRTLPFVVSSSSSSRMSLNASRMDGVYLDCMLTSDDEAHRRVWKMTLRTDESRGEKVYQAEYDLRGAMEEARRGAVAAATNESDDSGSSRVTWARVKVPFDDFRMVRGPRLVPDGPKLNVSDGIYQIGMTLSKFRMAVNTTEIENFRPGYFEMRIRRIGFYKNNDADCSAGAPPSSDDDVAVDVVDVPDTLTKEESMKRRPMALRVLLPVAKLFFSERANRRKSAMRILRADRGMTRLGAIVFGIRYRRRAGAGGIFPSIGKTACILGVDVFRAVARGALTVGVLYPFRLIGAIVNTMKRIAGVKIESPLKE